MGLTDKGALGTAGKKRRSEPPNSIHGRCSRQQDWRLQCHEIGIGPGPWLVPGLIYSSKSIIDEKELHSRSRRLGQSGLRTKIM